MPISVCWLSLSPHQGIQAVGMVGLRSHLPQLHAIKHVVLHTVDFAMPALVEMAVEPMAKRMTFGIEIGVEVVHHLALAFYIV